MGRLLKILIADEHPVVVAGLRAELFGENVVFCSPATTAQETVRILAIEQPDAVILDILFGGDVFHSLVRECRRLSPHSVIIVFTALAARPHRRLAFEAGADAFLEKSVGLPDLATHLAHLLDSRLVPPSADAEVSEAEAAIDAGKSVVPALPPGILLGPGPGATVRAKSIEIPHLTAREREVARLLSQGRPIAEIARVLGVEAKTAAVHRDNLRKKMQCRDTNELIARLARHYAAE